MEKIIKNQGFNLHYIHADKFKTNVISIKIKAKLDKKNITKRALLGAVLTGGINDHPSVKELSRHLEMLYGARLNVAISTNGNGTIININSSLVNDKFLPGDENLFEQHVKLVTDIIFNPNVINNAFSEEIVKEKKRELKERLEANLDDKYYYGYEQLVKNMGKGFALEIPTYGYIEEIDNISSKDLYIYLQEIIKTNIFDIYFVGDVEEHEVNAIISDYVKLEDRVDNITASYQLRRDNRSEVTEIIERQDITQSKLNMGYQIDTDMNDNDHYNFVVFNGIFGGFSHSKLFKIVREKHSLCYYVSSSYDAFNGVMIITAGIDYKQFDKTKKLVQDVLEMVQQGEINETDLIVTKAVISNAVIKAMDDPMGIVSSSYVRSIAGKEETIDQYIEKINAVTLDDVVRVANKVKLDTIFFLTGKEE